MEATANQKEMIMEGRIKESHFKIDSKSTIRSTYSVKRAGH